MKHLTTQPVTALPHAMSERDIVREHEESLARIVDEHDGVGVSASGSPCEREPIAEAPKSRPESLFEAVQTIRNAQRCPDCGKTRAIINWGRGFRPESPNPTIHCACVGGPAYAGVGSTLEQNEAPVFAEGARVIATRRLPYTAAHGCMRYVEPGTAGTITLMDAERRVTAIDFDDARSLYYVATERLASIVGRVA